MSIQDEYYYHLQDIGLHYVLLEGNNNNWCKIIYDFRIILKKLLKINKIRTNKKEFC